MRSPVKAFALSLCLTLVFGIIGCSTSNTGDQETETDYLVTKQASELVLTMDEVGEGWTQTSTENTTNARTGAQSAFARYYFRNTPMKIAAAVYPSIQRAKDVYSNEIPTKVSLDHPAIGDKCFLDTSNNVGASRLVFRRKNVVVWVAVRYYGTQYYARMVEAKIG